MVAMQDVRQRSASVRNLREQVSSDQDWKVQRDTDGIRTLYKESKTEGQVQLRIEGFLDTSIFHILALLYEVDLWHKWVPSIAGLGLGKASVIASASPTALLRRLTELLAEDKLMIAAECLREVEQLLEDGGNVIW